MITSPEVKHKSQQTASANGPGASPPPPHLHQRQVRVQVCEAVQDHRAGVLRHLQLHPVPNVPHLPRRVEHVEQLSRFDAARLGLRPGEIDHGCRAVRSVTAALQRRFLGVFRTAQTLLPAEDKANSVGSSSLRCEEIRTIMTHRRGGLLNPAHTLVLPSMLSEITIIRSKLHISVFITLYINC